MQVQLVTVHPSQETEDADAAGHHASQSGNEGCRMHAAAHFSFSIYSLGLQLRNAVTQPGGVFPVPFNLVIKISAHSHSQRPISQGFLGSVKLTIDINGQRQYYTDLSFSFKIYTLLVM